MKKTEATKLFGDQQKHLAKALGRSEAAVSQWPDVLKRHQALMVIGAAVMAGIPVPSEFLKP